MNSLIDQIKDFGCDTEGALERFVNDEELYCTYLAKIADDELFEALGRSLAENDMKASFESAHALKGVLGNMGLTPLYSVICEIVELLRKGTTDGVMPKYHTLMDRLEEYKKIIKSN